MSSIQGKDFHFKYRADIDGLRAIAVLLVLAFHAFPEIFKGGFLGVDIFFVISGYLISSIILGGLKKSTFTLKDFFIKRVNRIFPPLILILIFTLTIGWFGLTSEEYKELGRHAASAAFFVSNITYWLKSGYFDTSSELKPLLHIWSLSVEEQFYILWPTVLFFLYKWENNLKRITLILILVSFSLSLYLSYTNPNAAFYLPFSRFWEILIGAYLAFSTKNSEPNKRVQSFKSTLGIILIFTSAILVTKEQLFPGYWALFPTVGTYLIISSGSDHWINKKLLANPIFIWIGLISYPLYLWHWPFFSLTRVITAEPIALYLKISLLVLTFIFSWLTYRFFELPLRRVQSKKKPLILCIIISVLGITGAVIKSSKGFPSRGFDSVNNYQLLSSGFKGNNLISCDDLGLKLKTSSYCTKNEKSNILIVGDSHAPQLYPGFRQSQDSFFNKVDVLAAVSCNPVLNYYDDRNCSLLIQNLMERIDNTESKLSFIIIASHYRVYESLSESNKLKYLNGFTDLFKRILEAGITPVFYIDNYAFKSDPLNCVESKPPLRMKFANIPTMCHSLKESDIQEHEQYDLFVQNLQQKNPKVFFYNPRPILCKELGCSLFKDGKLLYSDVNHISIYGSSLVGDDLIVKLKELKK